MDGIDGIVARRRNQQSRLGEWLDHIFDSIDIAIMYSVSNRLRIGYFFIAYIINFVLMHIEHIITGKIRYSNGYIGAMEVQILTSGLLLFDKIPNAIVFFININAFIGFQNLYIGYRATKCSIHYTICSILIIIYTFFIYATSNSPHITLTLVNIAAVNSHLTDNLYHFYYRIIFYLLVSILNSNYYLLYTLLFHEMFYYPIYYLILNYTYQKE